MKYIKISSMLVLLVTMMLLLGCSADFMTPVNPQSTASVTLIPAFVATPQAAEAAAQATQAAGRGQMAQMNVTATALFIRREAVLLEMTQAASTQAYHADETRQCAAKTDFAGTTTQQANNDQATASRQAEIESAQKTETSISLSVLQASAQAEIDRIAEQRRQEQMTLLWRAWAIRLFWGTLGVLALVFVGFLVASFWKYRRGIFSRIFGTHRWGTDGKPYMYTFNDDGSLTPVDMSRSGIPALRIGTDGRVEIGGQIGSPELQAQIAAHAQVAEALLAANTIRIERDLADRLHGKSGRTRSGLSRQLRSWLQEQAIRQLAASQQLPQGESQPQLPAGNGQVIYLEPGDNPTLEAALSEADRRLMEVDDDENG